MKSLLETCAETVAKEDLDTNELPEELQKYTNYIKSTGMFTNYVPVIKGRYGNAEENCDPRTGKYSHVKEYVSNGKRIDIDREGDICVLKSIKVDLDKLEYIRFLRFDYPLFALDRKTILFYVDTFRIYENGVLNLEPLNIYYNLFLAKFNNVSIRVNTGTVVIGYENVEKDKAEKLLKQPNYQLISHYIYTESYTGTDEIMIDNKKDEYQGVSTFLSHDSGKEKCELWSNSEKTYYKTPFEIIVRSDKPVKIHHYDDGVTPDVSTEFSYLDYYVRNETYRCCDDFCIAYPKSFEDIVNKLIRSKVTFKGENTLDVFTKRHSLYIYHGEMLDITYSSIYEHVLSNITRHERKLQEKEWEERQKQKSQD